MRRLGILTVGKLKEPFFRKAFEHYTGRIAPLVPLDCREVKDGSGKLAPEDRRRKEGEALLKALDTRARLVLLDERGEPLTSKKLAKRLTSWFEDPGTSPVFLVGGAYGVSEEVKARADATLRLSDLTLPHELCRVLLSEALYRALSIQAGSPYHHE